MPGLIQETPFKTFTVRELHPTFGAELVGVDFDNMTDDGLNEIIAAMAKVRSSLVVRIEQNAQPIYLPSTGFASSARPG
jgi:hypothetical protein